MRLENKVAVITGGASGMGLATVMRFLQEGARVIIADFNEDNGEQAVRDAGIAGFDGSVSFVATDVAKEDDVANMIQAALSNYAGLDIVFNNAGVGGAIGPLTETTTSDWDYTFDVLAKGVFLGIKHAAIIMKANGTGGSIINTASIAGQNGLSAGSGSWSNTSRTAAAMRCSRRAVTRAASSTSEPRATFTSTAWERMAASAWASIR